MSKNDTVGFLNLFEEATVIWSFLFLLRNMTTGALGHTTGKASVWGSMYYKPKGYCDNFFGNVNLIAP